MKPLHIFVDGSELVNYTDFSMRRSKTELTGSASITLFMNSMPRSPVQANVSRGADVNIYIGGHLAFNGGVDRRTDNGDKSGKAGVSEDGGFSLSVGPDQYSLQFDCRGKARTLVDSSHQHPTGSLLRTTSKKVAEELVAPFGIEIDWQAEDVGLEKWRLRDGATVIDEIQRLAEGVSLYVRETRDGKLRFTDAPETNFGEPIVLGTNILSFSTSQAEDRQKKEVVVKGQLTGKDKWGEEAVLNTSKKIQDGSVTTFKPLTVQLFGDATEEALEKRARYEASQRITASKRITVDVFHIQQSSGEPWDVGVQHYVEIPPAGVFSTMEVVDVNYQVSGNGSIKTALTLSPPPLGRGGANGLTSALQRIAPRSGSVDAVARVNQFPGADLLSSSWGGPVFDVVENVLTDVLGDAGSALQKIGASVSEPALTLPANFRGVDE